jgi:hypothetical protein
MTNEKRNPKKKRKPKVLKVEKDLVAPARRDLTLKEKKRIEQVEQRRGNTDVICRLFKASTNKDGELSTKVLDLDLRQDLSELDGIKEIESRFMQATGLHNFLSAEQLIRNSVTPLLPENASLEIKVKMLNEMGSMMTEFAPKDAIEGTLCSQIITCQQMGMDLMRKSSVQRHTDWMRTLGNASSKLLARSQNALKMLIDYRRGGKQQIIVEHVNMAPGSKAAFGHFESNQGGGEGVNKKNSRGTL